MAGAAILTPQDQAVLARAPRKGDYLTPRQRAFDEERRRVSRENAWMAVPALAPAAAIAAVVSVPLAVAGAVNAARFIAEGREFKLGPNLRIAPFGNRTGHASGRYPHYHRRGAPIDGKTPPGQGIGRHRPWETKATDMGFLDRF